MANLKAIETMINEQSFKLAELKRFINNNKKHLTDEEVKECNKKADIIIKELLELQHIRTDLADKQVDANESQENNRTNNRIRIQYDIDQIPITKYFSYEDGGLDTSYKCDNCCGDEYIERENYYSVCTKCGQIISYDYYFTHSEEMNINSIAKNGGYKPNNHFIDIIAQFQGKKRTFVTDNTIDEIREECKRHNISESNITPQIVRHFLKRMHREEYYKYIVDIIKNLSDTPPPYMTPMQEEELVNAFNYTVWAYKQSPRFLDRKRKRGKRKKLEPNNMNYKYIFFKLCQLKGFYEFLPFITLPKSNEGLDDMDENGWKYICKTLNWEYIPTR